MADENSITTYVGWLATGGLIAWVTALITLRKDDRAVVIDNVTKERKEWRVYLRKWCADVSSLALSKEDWDIQAYMRLKSELITRLNPIDHIDHEIIKEYEKLDPDQIRKSNKKEVIVNLQKKEVIVNLQKKIGCLLKQDWENVKNECNPFYSKFFSFSKIKKSYECEKELYKKTVKCPYTDHSEIDKITIGPFIVAMLPALVILIINIIFLLWFFDIFKINSALIFLIFMPTSIFALRCSFVIRDFCNR